MPENQLWQVWEGERERPKDTHTEKNPVENGNRILQSTHEKNSKAENHEMMPRLISNQKMHDETLIPVHNQQIGKEKDI